MNHAARILSVLPFLVLLGCFEDQTAGTSTETENAVSARSILVDSVLDSGDRAFSGPTVAVLRLDAGNFDFSKSDDSARDIAVQTIGGIPIPFEIVDWDRPAARGRLDVRIDGPLFAPGARFLLLAGEPLAHRSNPAEVWAGIADSQKLALNSALVDDFEGGNILHNRLPDSSFWYVGGSIPPSGLAMAGSGRAGTALELVCATGQCDTGRALLAATLLATSPRSLRSMDSLEFWARGTGNVWISLEHLDSTQLQLIQEGKLDSLQPERAWASHVLDTTWRRIRIAPSDFDSGDGLSGNIGWTGVRDSVNYVTFLIQGGSQLWLDDIRIFGIDRDDLR
jgi:hypothetical protein